jgi:hypothetical protein
MARYSLGYSSYTHSTGTADGATIGATFPAHLVGGGVAARIAINEIYIGGEAPATSTPVAMRLGRDSTLSTTPAAGNVLVALLDVTSSAQTAPPLGYGSAATGPTRSATLGRLLMLSLNAYGGISRWQARVGEEIIMYGNAVSVGAISLSPFTGSTAGITSGHILFEQT